MYTRNKLLTSILAAALALGTAGPVPLARAQADHTTTHTIENFDLVLPAEFGCTGEDVHIVGPIDETIQTTMGPSGSATVVMHFTPHLQAVGLTSGAAYIAVGPSTQIVHTGVGAQTTTFVNITRLIAPGSAPNLTFDEMAHVTVNANGQTTVSFDNFHVSCHG